MPVVSILAKLVVVAMIALNGGASSSAGSDAYKVIVHPDSKVSAVDRELLRNAYLKKANQWKGGQAIRPIDLSSKHTVREKFTREVLRKTPAQLRSYWNQQIFSGKAVPPPEVDTPDKVIAYVVANPGAVGYIPVDADEGRAKVIKVK